MADQVYERLEENILNGEYKEGDVLTEKQLAMELGVSRTPIREALSMLAYDSLVYETPQGTVVRGINAKDVEDLYAVKKKLEVDAVQKAAKNMDPEDLEALTDVVDQQVYFAGKGQADKVRNLDTEFHDIIYKGCGSLVYENILTHVHHKLKKYRSNSLRNKSRIMQSVEEHQAILEAIKARDSAKAGKLMTEHLQNSYKSVMASTD